jgi:two-component system OmpR family response regulator
VLTASPFDLAPMMIPPHDETTAHEPHILIVDDDRDIRVLLSDSLRSKGFRASLAANTREMGQILLRDTVDLVILDVMMPGEDGIAACRRLVAADGPPVVFLSARGDERDRVLGLDTGASHYLPKPCSAREVLATVRAALRMRQSEAERAASAFLFDGWRMDVEAHELTDPNGVLIALTEGEFAVLRVFVERPRRVLSRETLLEAARGPDSDSFDRAVDVQISRLRRKLGAPADEIIRPVRNEGYLFVPAVVRR